MYFSRTAARSQWANTVDRISKLLTIKSKYFQWFFTGAANTLGCNIRCSRTLLLFDYYSFTINRTQLSIIVNRSKLREYRSTHRPLPLTLCVYACRARSCSHSFLCIDISAIFSWAAFSRARARSLATQIPMHGRQCVGGTGKIH